MKLSVLIPTHDRREALARAIRGVEALTYPDVEIVVVDDGSSDGTWEMLVADFPHVRAIRLERQSGVGVARSAGFAQATGDVLVGLDDDAYLIATDAGERIAERFSANPMLGALCFRVETPDGWVRHREIPRRDKRMPRDGEEIGYYLSGAVALRASALREVGGFPTDIRYAAEEADISFRLAAAGYRIGFTDSVVVAHEAIPGLHNTTDREANYVHSHVRLAARFLPAPYAQVHAAAWIVVCLARALGAGTFPQTWHATREALGSWGACRAEGLMLDRALVRHLTAVSARTWY